MAGWWRRCARARAENRREEGGLDGGDDRGISPQERGEREGDALTINAPSGAALRASAETRRADHRGGGGQRARIDKLATSGEWYRVKRDAWVQNERSQDRGEIIAAAGVASARAPASQRAPEKACVAGTSAAAPAAAPPPRGAGRRHGHAGGIARADGRPAGDFAAAHPLVLRAAPDGKPAAPPIPPRACASSRAITAGRACELEGWVRESELVPVDSSSVSAVSAADLRSDPDHYKGSTVRWVVQAISVQSADPLRKGLAPDEPYLLARGPGSESSLLYLALPPRRSWRARGRFSRSATSWCSRACARGEAIRPAYQFSMSCASFRADGG